MKSKTIKNIKNSENMKKRWSDPIFKAEMIKKLSKARKKWLADPKNKQQFEDMKIKQSQTMKRKIKEGLIIRDAKYMKNLVLTRKKRDNSHITPEYRAKLSKSLQGHPGYTKGRIRPQSEIDKLKNTLRQNPDILHRIKLARLNQKFPLRDTAIEIKVKNFLIEEKIEYIEQYKIINITDFYRCDFYLPKFNVVIECDGDYWHTIPKVHERNILRTVEMREKGYIVLRFMERTIENDFDFVKDSIRVFA